MKCSRCGEEMKIKHIRTGTDKNGNPIYHKYALCYNCKIRRDLEKEKHTSAPAKRKKGNRKTKKKVLLILLALILLASVVTAIFFFYQKSQKAKEKEKNTIVTNQRKNLITASNYNDLKLGMSMEDVQDLIGTEGNLLMRTSIEDAVTERYQWITKEEEGTVLLTFQNEKLISISQTGMNDESSSEITENSVKELTPGMPLEDVNSTLKSRGIRLSETILDGVTTSTYGWKQKGTDSLYSAVFVDGIMQYSSSIQIEAPAATPADTPKESGE